MGVFVGLIYDYCEVFEDLYMFVCEMMVEIEHLVEGAIRVLGILVKLSDMFGVVWCLVLLFGEYIEEVLCEVGIVL